MKTGLSLILVFFTTFIVNAQEFKFESETIDYGVVNQGSERKRVFKFTNVGDAPLIIKGIKAPCPCFIGKTPEKPIMPGEKGEIEVIYDTKRLGSFSKVISVFSNAKIERRTLRGKGNVVSGN